MIKLKKYTALTLCALTLTTTPLSALADEYDQKIADQDKKISDLQQTEQSAEDQKAALEQQVAAVEQEVNAVLRVKEIKRFNSKDCYPSRKNSKTGRTNQKSSSRCSNETGFWFNR